jgi:superfamily II DNA or RNA helicase
MSKIAKIIVHDEVWITIQGLDHADHFYLWDFYGVYADGYRWMPSYKLGRWDGKVRFFDNSGKIYFQFVEDIIDILTSRNYQIEFEDQRAAITIVQTKITEDYFHNKSDNGFKLRPYQVQAVNTCLEAGTGIVVAATGSGKTSLTAALCQAYGENNVKCIVIVPSSDLVQQTSDFFKMLKVSHGVYCGNEKNLTKMHCIATWQALQHSPSIMKQFQSVIVDECFAGDQRVLTPEGYKRIDGIKIGDKVLSWKANGEIRINSIQRVLANRNPSSKMMELTFNTGIIKVTEDHKFYIANGQKIPAKELTEQHILISPTPEIKMRLISKRYIERPSVVYDLTVVNDHNYFVEGALVSNCHGASAKTIGDLINEHGKHIPYRFGLTGTMPKTETDLMTIRGSLGNILYSITAADLIKMGYLAKLEIQPIEILEKASENFPDYASEHSYICKQPDRLELLADLVINAAQENGNTLVLTSKKLGAELHKLIKDSVFLSGDTKKENRSEWYSKFETENNLIVIATVGIAATGISIDRIFHLFVVDAGKAFERCIQSIGRGLRKGRDKDFVSVTDVYSSLKWSKKHMRERLKYYRESEYPVLDVIKIKA